MFPTAASIVSAPWRRVRPAPYQYVRKRPTGRAGAAVLLACLALAGGLMSDRVLAETVRLAALGDSLTAGYGLAAAEAFPMRLQAALRHKGYNVTIANDGVSGDTTAGGLARLNAVIAAKPDGVILEFGINDALQGVPVARVRANLATMLEKLRTADIAVLLCGARAFGTTREYATAFAAMYAALAKRYDAVLFPFFLEGVAGRPDLLQADGLHPKPSGVDVIVARFLPVAETFLHRLGAAPAPTVP